MRLKITPKPDAEEHAYGRILDPANVVLCADGRVLQRVDDTMGNGTTCRLVDVTGLFDVEVAEDLWQVVLTTAQLDAVRVDLERLVHRPSYSSDSDRRQLYRELKDAFSKAELVR